MAHPTHIPTDVLRCHRLRSSDIHITALLILTHILTHSHPHPNLGSVAAIYTSQRLREIIEETDAWAAYKALTPKKRATGHALISKALVEAYKMVDVDLRDSDFMDQSGCTAGI
jgi:hypothetical protein